MPRVLITGGAGFVGSNLATGLASAGWDVIALDSLKRRGSELNLPRLRSAGVEFVHGDIREPADLAGMTSFDALVEASAEPSVMAGVEGDTAFPVHTNLLGAYNCLELARRHEAFVVFLSTSRVYPLEPLAGLAYRDADTRFELLDDQPLPGASAEGISERFPLQGARTLYGATKLAAELLLEEYRAAFGLRAVVDRCGVIAGPWQMGKADQGVVTFWALHHHLGLPLRYIGYGGSGKQVRDVLHVDDLTGLVARQLERPGEWDGVTVNVGGGRGCSVSLLEATALCRELTGREVPIEPDPEGRPGDVPIYVSDCGLLYSLTDWRPGRGVRDVFEDVLGWIERNERAIVPALGLRG